MKQPPARSLSGRLVRHLAIVQAAAVVLWLLAFMAFSPYISYEELAAASSQARVAAAVERGPDGALVVALVGRARGLRVAPPGLRLHRDTRRSHPVRLLARARRAPRTLGHRLAEQRRAGDALRLPRPGGAAVAGPHPHGEVVVATTGDVFRFEDVGTFLSTYLPQFAFMFGPAILAAALVIPLVVNRSLRPVRAAAGQAAAIEVSSLDRRLPDAHAPSELRPFIGAINALLRRVEEGVAWQRMFTANAAHELRTPVAHPERPGRFDVERRREVGDEARRAATGRADRPTALRRHASSEASMPRARRSTSSRSAAISSPTWHRWRSGGRHIRSRLPRGPGWFGAMDKPCGRRWQPG